MKKELFVKGEGKKQRPAKTQTLFALLLFSVVVAVLFGAHHARSSMMT
jgi:hypothetical protein